MTVLIATTIAPWKCDGNEELAWCRNAQGVAAVSDVRYFAALEVDGRNLEPYGPMLAHFAGQPVIFDHWRFALDDHTTEANSPNRLHRICLGRNLCQAYAQADPDISHILFVDSDVQIPTLAVERLLELDWPIVGGHVGAYCLDGPRVNVDGDVRAHWNTAGFLMVAREVFSRVAWNTNPDAGMTDDPAYQRNAHDLFGYETWVRHDLEGRHPPAIPVEHRAGDRTRVAW